METAETTEKPTADPNAVHCKFWDPESQAGKNLNSKCEGAATGFVRITHSNRLCPLCAPCKETFLRAQKEMSADVKTSIPGQGEFSEVALDDGKVEYAAQAPKK